MAEENQTSKSRQDNPKSTGQGAGPSTPEEPSKGVVTNVDEAAKKIEENIDRGTRGITESVDRGLQKPADHQN